MHDLAWHELSARLALALAHFLWQGVLVAAAVSALLRLVRGSSRVRYGIALCGLTLMAALPVATLCAVDTPEEWWRSETVPSRPLEIVPHDVQQASPVPALAESPTQTVPPGSTTAPLVTPTPPLAAPAVTAIAPSSTAPPPAPPVWIAATPWVATVYIAGVLLMLVRVSLGIRGNHLLRRNSRPIIDTSITARLRNRAAALRLRITPALAVCEQITVPTVIGVLRPLILLPASLVSGLPLDQLDAVLTHELAHIRRWDPVVNFLQRLIEAVLFFHPGVWYVSRKVREAREHCCDDLVVSLGVSPVDYATSLLDVAERAVRSPARLTLPHPAAALHATGQRSQLGGRVRRLLGADEPESLRVKHPGFVLILIAALSLCLATAVLDTSAAPEPESSEANEDPAQYEVTLPNGTTVRLLGVTEYPYEGKRWWTADGTPCDPVPGPINTSSTYDGPPVISRLIVFDASGLPADCRTDAVLTPTKSAAIGNDRAGNRQHRTTFIARFDPATQTAEAGFTFTSGSWTKAAEFDRNGKPVGDTAGAGREIAFEEVKSSDGSWGQTEVIFNVPDTSGGVRLAWRAQVVTNDGMQHKSAHDQWGKQGGEDRTRYRLGFDVPREQIERIVIEQDSFVLGVRFSGISLHPGQKTDVKIETETAGVLPREVLADMVTRAVLERAKWQHLSERRSSLSREQAAGEFRELVTKYAPQELPREQYQSLLSAIERQMSADGWRNAPADDLDYQDWCYLHAPELLRNLQWRLYLALIREPLTPGQQQRRNQQRDWMREFVRALPAVGPQWRDKTHEAVLRSLEERFNDPLCPAFHEPLADDKFALLQAEIESLDRSRGLIFIEHHLTWEAAAGLMRSDAAEVPVPFHERAQSFGARSGVLYFEFPSTNLHKGMPNNLSDYPDGNIIVSQPAYIMLWGGVPQETVAKGLEAIQAYCADNNVGDFLFDADNRRLVALRGAKLLALPTGKTTRWYDIDELPTDRLRNIIRQDGDVFFALPEAISVSNVGEERLHQYVGLLLPDERVLVIHLSQLAHGQLSLRVRAHENSAAPAAPGQPRHAVARAADSQVRAGDVAMPLYYEDTMLVVHNEHGAAAITFDAPVQEGDPATDGRHVVRYRWRLKDDRVDEQTGSGQVYEQLPDNDFERGKWFIEAGPFQLAWSQGNGTHGWVYFNPVELSVHPVKNDWFEDRPVPVVDGVEPALDLLQFLLPDTEFRKSIQTQVYNGPGTIPTYPRIPYAAPVRYATTLLIVSTPDGVAAFRFGTSFAGDTAAPEARFGVKYRFQFASHDGTRKLNGEGEVYELYRSGQYQNEGTLHYLEAGPIHLPWSQGGPESGWIYFDPAWHTVWFTKPELFDARGGEQQPVDLLRFRVGDRPLPLSAATAPASGEIPSANGPTGRRDFIWGDAVDGLQVGIRLAESPFEAVSAADRRYAIDVQFRNTTDRDITVPVFPYVHPGKDPLSSTPHWNALASIKDEDRVCRVTVMALLEPDQDARNAEQLTIPAGKTVDLPGGPVTLRITENSGTITPEPSVHYEFVRQTYPFNRFPNDPKLRFEIRVAPITAAPSATAKTAFSGPLTLEFDDPRIASGSTVELLEQINSVLATAPGLRSLVFPADHPIGRVSIRPAGPMQVPDIRDWEPLGLAQATVAIPAAHEVKLHVSTRGALDLSFLDDLPVNALHTLDLNDTGVEDDQMRHIGRLTGLKSLQMQGNEFTDRGMQDLRPLVDLEVLKLSKFGSARNISDDSLAAVAALPNMKQLDLRMTQVGDAGMAAIAGMTQLTCLDVSGTNVTDEGLKHVGRLANMEYLDLGIYSHEGIPCTDAGLAHLSGLTHLRWLRLAGSKVTDAGLKHLSGMQELTHLSLDRCEVTNAGLALLSPLEELEELWLPRTLDDEGCEALARLKNLREIVGDTDSVTDAGVAQLATLAHLERLTLEGDEITDRSLASLKQARQLKWLHLYDTSITDSGLAMLREMPQLELLRIRGQHQTDACLPHVARLPRLMLLTLSLSEDRENTPPMDLSPLAGVGTVRILELDGPSAVGVNLDPVAGLSLERLIIEAPIGNRELEIIGRISTLSHLEVGGAEITNDGLLHLAELRSLEILTLRGSFDDAGLSQLQGLPRLRHAQFSARGVTEKGIAELLAACPSLQRASTFGSE